MNWKSILATGLVTAIVTIGTGMFLFWWQTKEPVLTYNYIRSIPFEDSQRKVFIQQIEVKNTGNETAEDATLVVKFKNSKIEKSNINIDNAIKYEKTISDNSISLSISSLNPNEGLSLSVLLEGNSQFDSNPDISLRAKGIVGEKIGASSTEKKPTILIALAAAYAGIFTFVLSIKKYRDTFLLIATRLFKGKPLSSGSQKEILASILSMHGFPQKAKEYLTYGSERRYWVESDLLSAEAICNDDNEKNRYINVLTQLAELTEMAESSRAIVYYNIARIKKSQGNDYDIYLDMAKKIDLKEIEFRLTKDPVFSKSI